MNATRTREKTAQPTDDVATASVLAVANHTNEKKIERHYVPLADVASEITMVCFDGHDATDDIAFQRVPHIGHRVLGFPLLFVVACLEARRGDYDAVVSMSLFPYGCISLLVGRLFGLPVHLGIIGIDLDSHATAWYGPIPRLLFRQFDSISVPGPTHVRKLAGMGVSPQKISVLRNAIDVTQYTPPAVDAERDVDLLWVGRFSDEKDPLRFVEALAELDATHGEFDAVMLGAGPLEEAVQAAIDELGLSESVSTPGWVTDPRPYYRRAKVFVLTSRRDALPFTLVESMATAVVPVVPRVGSCPDTVTDGEDGLVVDDRQPGTLAAAMARLLSDDQYRRSLSENATAVRNEFSLENASADWRRILRTLSEQAA